MLGPDMHVDVTVFQTLLHNKHHHGNTYSLMIVASLGWINLPATLQKIVQGWLEEHNKQSKALTWLPNLRDFDLIKHQ